MSDATSTQGASSNGDRVLFWGCFVALIATAFGFIIRAMIIGDLQAEFGLTETQKGEIIGVGLWPFALSIVLFSLIIDRIGYGRAMVFAFVCHIVSAVLTIFATGYWMLYIGTFIVALGNGTVEAVINPVVATMFKKDKTKWLNILHAGWPGGLVLGGLLTLALGADMDWRVKVGLIVIPTIVYGIMLMGRKFPVHERVAAGVTYRDMLAEAGAIGALIVVALITFELGRVSGIPLWVSTKLGIPAFLGIPGFWVNVAFSLMLTGAYAAYVRSLGRPIFIFLLLIMMPLATTELGTDAWITELVTPEMKALGYQAGWVLVYTSFIMMVLRFVAGPIVHALSPLGLLALSSLIAAVGLVALSWSAGIAIILAATLYALGKTFFWPTMLGVVAEQFPKGGALTLNSIAGVGMLCVGIVGAPFLGFFQDSSIDKSLQAYDTQNQTQLHASYVVQEKVSVFGEYKALDQEKLQAAPEDEQEAVGGVLAGAKKGALRTVAIFPVIMLVCYLLLILYFKSKGGYTVVHLDEGGEGT